MSEYKNFNNYEIKEDAEKENAVTAADNARAGANGAAEAPQQNAGTDVLGIISVTLAPMSCCCSGVAAIAGLIVGIIGLKKNRNSTLSLVGVILCSLAVLYIAYSIITMMRHPEEYQAMMEQYSGMLDQFFDAAGGTAGRFFR